MKSCFAIAVVCLLAGSARAENWPMWRGPRGDGVSAEKGVPVKWDANRNIAWRTAIAGKGHSSPVIWDNRLYLTTCIENEQSRRLLCLDIETGRVLWDREYLKAPLEKKHGLNSYATPTPATDGQRVFITTFGQPNSWLICFDMDGQELWRKSPGTFKSMHGWATAPMLFKDTVIMNCDQDAEAYLVAFDKVTGAEKWRTDRPNRVRSYCNPLFVEAAGKTQMVLTGSKCTGSYDPETGKQRWLVDGPTEQFVSTPVFADGVIFITGGFPTFHLMGIDPSGSGNVSKSHVLWHDSKNGAYVPSPVAVNELFFAVSDEGRAFCIEPKTGKKLWSQQLGKHHYPSPVSADGLLYFLSSDGEMFVLKAADTFELVARNELGEHCNASPAISRGRMYIRTSEAVYCVKGL